MLRPLAAIAWLTLTSGIVSAGEFPFAASTQNAAHETECDENASGDAAQRRLRQMLKEIIEQQKSVRDGIGRVPPPHLPRTYTEGVTLGFVPTVKLKRGMAVTVNQSISWNHYPKDDIEVTVAASDASLTVPKKLTLDFEKHQFRFEYEIKAGDKVGEFTVTLTPTPGKPVEVKVIVR